MNNETYPHDPRIIVVLFLLLATLISLTVHASQSEVAKPGVDTVPHVNLSNRYAINLLSSLKPFDPSDLPGLDVFEKYRLYTTRFNKDGRIWHALRLGFFPTKKAAQKVVDSLRGLFRGAWVITVSRREREESALLAIAPATTAVPEKPVQSEPPISEQKTVEKEQGTSPQISEKRLERLIEEAEKAMTSGNYPRAIQIYTKILEYPDHKFRQAAQELLGLARDRNGQLAQARAEYEKYLRLFPEGEEAERVRQRLAGLVTARAKPRERLRKAKKEEARTEIFGSYSQFYSRFESFTDLGGNVVSRSSLSSDIDLNINRQTAAYNLSYVVTGGYERDFLDNGDGEGTLSQHYIDMFDRRRLISGRIGRQPRSTDGVLGRFDGGVLSYQFLEWAKINLLSGFPLDSAELKSIDTDKYFYGVSIDLGTIANQWDFNLYTIRQISDGITDRHAVGGEVRYFRPNGSFFSLFDYDLSYDELNTILFVGNWIFPNKTTISTQFDYRKNPILTSGNALIGQGVDSLSDLLRTLSESQVRDLARDRTATSWTFTLGLTHPLTQKLQLSGDFTVSEFKGTEASGGVAAVDGTGNDYFYSTQLIGTSLIKQGDVAILGLRYSDTSSSDTVSLDLNTRYPLNRDFRINPRMLISYSRGNQNNPDQLRFRPEITVDYYWKRRVRFELNGGVESRPDWVSGQTDSDFDYFVNLGFRIDY